MEGVYAVTAVKTYEQGSGKWRARITLSVIAWTQTTQDLIDECKGPTPTYLSLPDEPINTDHDESTLRARWIKPVYTETHKALEYVLSEDSRGRQIRKANDCDDLLRWYFEEVVLKHYTEHALPGLIQVIRAALWPRDHF